MESNTLPAPLRALGPINGLRLLRCIMRSCACSGLRSVAAATARLTLECCSPRCLSYGVALDERHDSFFGGRVDLEWRVDIKVDL